ncbi:hypothetical protein Tco_1404031 [Tanacetum coccineum]
MMVAARSDGCDEMKVVVAWSTRCGGSSGGEGDGVVVMGGIVVEGGGCTVVVAEEVVTREAAGGRSLAGIWPEQSCHFLEILKKMPPKRTATTTPTTPMTDAQIKALIARGVADALAERDADRSKNGDDSHDSGGDGRRRMPVARECTYTDFLKCQPLNFKGTEGVVGLTQWIKKMESVFYISNYTIACQFKFATCTLQGNALAWWNSHVRTVRHDVAYAMP